MRQLPGPDFMGRCFGESLGAGNLVAVVKVALTDKRAGG